MFAALLRRLPPSLFVLTLLVPAMAWAASATAPVLPPTTSAAAASITPADASPAPTQAVAAPVPATATTAVGAPAAPAAMAEGQVYLLARVTLTGSDFAEVVFLKHPALRTLEDCEIERNAGLTTGWVHLSAPSLRTFRGKPYKVEYRCVTSPQQMTVWRSGVLYDQFYRVISRDQHLQVQPFPDFFACRRTLPAVQAALDAFCAASSQTLVSMP